MKKLSPKKIEERRERREKAKKERIIMTLSAIPPFILTVVTIILYACKITPAALLGATAAVWFVLGGVFIYAYKMKWGYSLPTGARSDKSTNAVTVYNIVLVILLGVLFAALFIRKLI
jgi:hypothetical protein